MRRALTSHGGRLLASSTYAALLALAICAQPTSAWAQRQQHVLTLYSTRADAEIASIGGRVLPRILGEGRSGELDYHVEFIDPSRVSPTYPDAFRDYLRQKYTGLALDLVIAMDAGALGFVNRYRIELFPGAPVVFFSSRPSPPRPPNSTGVNAVINLRDTVRLAAALQPALRNIFVVTGADRSYEMLAKAELEFYATRFSITYLSALETGALEQRLAALPPDSMVYYVHVIEDGAGLTFNALDYLDRISAVANAPTYSWFDSSMGHGIVGGSLRSLTAQMNDVGRLALRVLSGEPADSIPVTQPDLNVTSVDWRQLRRWRISERRVPPGTTIAFREPSAWQRYRAYIISATIVLIGQAALIAALLVQRRRRQRAEQLAATSQAALAASYERIRGLGAKLLNAQEAERARIARELHDDVSQQLVLLTIELTSLGAAGALERAQAIARTVHELSYRLHSDRLGLLGLIAAIRGLQHELSSISTEIVFTHDDVPANVPAAVAFGLYRVAQEALQNAVMHSQSAHVMVHLQGGGGVLALTIADDGVGFDVDKAWATGLGLASMRERIQSLGGEFDIRSTPGAGTRVSVRVPCDISPAHPSETA
jgi:signal transduction histidine kinase